MATARAERPDEMPTASASGAGPGLRITLNGIPGFFGFMGIGHMVGGSVGAGIFLLLFGWLSIFLVLSSPDDFGTALFGFGYYAVWVWSILHVRSPVRRMPSARRIYGAAKYLPKFPVFFISLLIVMAVFAPVIAPFHPEKGVLQHRNAPPFWMDGSPDGKYLGADKLGRDILSRLIHGSRVSLSVSALVILFGGAVGTVVGLMSGYYGGWPDMVMMRIVDIGLSIPLFLIALLMAVLFDPSYRNIIIIISVLIWPYYARQIRGEALAIKQRDFVLMAKVIGTPGWKIIVKHMLPNVVPTLLVLATLQVGAIILLEASLSFLGVGIPPPKPAWGLMVADGRGLITSAWWLTVFPGLAILFTVMSFNLLGDWIRDRLDPRLRQI